MTDNAPEMLDPELHADKFDPTTGGYLVTFEKYTALVAERDRALEWRDHDRERALAAEAQFEQAKTLYRETLDRAVRSQAAIQSALERLEASMFTNAEHQQAKDILKNALKPR